MPTKRPVVIARGPLTVSVVRRGTASEHASLVIDDAKRGRLVLTPLQGNPLELPPQQSLCGRQVQARGYLLGSELRYLSIEPAD
jgi:hypothetical protein